MGAPRPPYTAEELFRMSSPDKRQQLVRGELTDMAPAGFRHGEIAFRIGFVLGEHIRGRGLGIMVAAETGFLLERSPDTVLAPDVAFVSRHRLGEMLACDGYLPIPPDLVVEVMSPSESIRDAQVKAGEWLAFGVAIVWVVNPARKTIAVYAAAKPVCMLNIEDRVDGGAVLPDFECPVRAFFED